MSIKLECANCGQTEDLPENPSVGRIDHMARDFWLDHSEKPECTEQDIFVRTFSLCVQKQTNYEH